MNRKAAIGAGIAAAAALVGSSIAMENQSPPPMDTTRGGLIVDIPDYNREDLEARIALFGGRPLTVIVTARTDPDAIAYLSSVPSVIEVVSLPNSPGKVQLEDELQAEAGNVPFVHAIP